MFLFVSFFLVRGVYDFESFLDLISPGRILERRRLERLAELEAQRESLLLELEKKTSRLQELVDYVSTKFEGKKKPVLEALAEFDGLMSRDLYFSRRDLGAWVSRWSNLRDVVDLFFSLESISISFEEELSRLNEVFQNCSDLVKDRNRRFVKGEMERYGDFFGSLEKYPLTRKQMEAIVVDEHRNLVIAGAGTGKTSTLVGKVGYLLEKGLVSPDEVLLLSFGSDPNEEMADRVSEKFSVGVDVNTFHSLGMRIIGEVYGRKPMLTVLKDSVMLQHFISELINQRRFDPAFLRALNRFFLAKTEYRSLWEFNSMSEYYQYLRENEVRSLKGELVKSFEELEIANFLFSNGVNYEYERAYEYDTGNSLRARCLVPKIDLNTGIK